VTCKQITLSKVSLKINGAKSPRNATAASAARSWHCLNKIGLMLQFHLNAFSSARSADGTLFHTEGPQSEVKSDRERPYFRQKLGFSRTSTPPGRPKSQTKTPGRKPPKTPPNPNSNTSLIRRFLSGAGYCPRGEAFGRTLGGPHVVRPPKNDELWIRVGKGAVLRREFDYCIPHRTAANNQPATPRFVPT